MTKKRAKQIKRRPARPQRTQWDMDHADAIAAFDHCPCWYDGKVCCGCGEEKPLCQWTVGRHG